MKTTRQNASNQILISHINGFTLIELIASLVLLGLLTAIFGLGLVAAMRSNEFSRVNVQLAQKGQLAMARITRELMELTSIEAIADTSAGQDPFIIYSRLPTIGILPEGRYAIHFNSMDGTVRLYTNLDPTVTPPLDASSIANGDILVDGAAAFALNFFQGSSNWTWGSDQRRLSSIGVTLQLRRPDQPNRTQDFNTLVHLRNTNNFGGAAPTNTPVSINDYSCFIGSLID